jgi:hypothetical protein
MTDADGGKSLLLHGFNHISTQIEDAVDSAISIRLQWEIYQLWVGNPAFLIRCRLLESRKNINQHCVQWQGLCLLAGV